MRPESTPEMIARARQFVLEKPSTSYVQRKLMIGYNHACELMEHFEAEGLISPRRADGKREVLVRR
jgi:DNA segregation ATPase FtsK/SpoIIIE-like protein